MDQSGTGARRVHADALKRWVALSVVSRRGRSRRDSTVYGPVQSNVGPDGLGLDDVGGVPGAFGAELDRKTVLDVTHDPSGRGAEGDARADRGANAAGHGGA